MLFYWEHKNIKVALKMNEGGGTIIYQKTGEEDLENNIYTAIPINRANSYEYREVVQGTTTSMSIPGNLCYTCWFFIKV